MAYADDLALVCNPSHVNKITMFFTYKAEEYDFTANLGNTKVLTKSIKYINCYELIRKEKYFKYLGIYIEARVKYLNIDLMFSQ